MRSQNNKINKCENKNTFWLFFRGIERGITSSKFSNVECAVYSFEEMRETQTPA